MGMFYWDLICYRHAWHEVSHLSMYGIVGLKDLVRQNTCHGNRDRAEKCLQSFFCGKCSVASNSSLARPRRRF